MSERFATTQWSLVLAARAGTEGEARQALESPCQAYWYPLHAYVRRRGHDAEAARDLTQAFFTDLLGREFARRQLVARPSRAEVRRPVPANRGGRDESLAWRRDPHARKPGAPRVPGGGRPRQPDAPLGRQERDGNDEPVRRRHREGRALDLRPGSPLRRAERAQPRVRGPGERARTGDPARARVSRRTGTDLAPW